MPPIYHIKKLLNQDGTSLIFTIVEQCGRSIKSSICILSFLWLAPFAIPLTSQALPLQPSEVLASKRIDSLEAVIKTVQHVPSKLKLQIQLADEYQKTNLTKAIALLLKTEEQASRLKKDSLLARIHFNLGNYFFYNGAYNQAIAYYKRYYEFYDNDKGERYLLFVIPNLGALASITGDYKKALAYYHQAEGLYNKVRSKIGESQYYHGIVVVKNNIANIYGKYKKYPEAISIYKQALSIAEMRQDITGVGNICRNLGNIYISTNRPDSALAYLNRSYNAKKSTKDISALASTCYSLAQFYSKAQNLQLYESWLNDARKYAEQSSSLSILSSIEWSFYELYKSKGNYQAALSAFEHFKKLNDTLNNMGNMRTLVRTQTLLEIEKAQKEKQLAQQRRENNYIIIMILALATAVIFGLMVKVHRDRNRRLQLSNKANELERRNLEQAVQIKNQELATNVLYLVQKNELISGIIKKLYDLKVTLSGEKSEITGRIISELKTGLNTGNWEEFEMRFQHVNSEFYARLSEKHPNLTPNERRLCALLRLNMSTKEIMAMTGQNARSIEMARHRLRKKLDMESSANLVNFFMEI